MRRFVIVGSATTTTMLLSLLKPTLIPPEALFSLPRATAHDPASFTDFSGPECCCLIPIMLCYFVCIVVFIVCVALVLFQQDFKMCVLFFLHLVYFSVEDSCRAHIGL